MFFLVPFIFFTIIPWLGVGVKGFLWWRGVGGTATEKIAAKKLSEFVKYPPFLSCIYIFLQENNE